ncbi:MAG: folate-binding protein [Anaeromyxobacter sp.]
MTTLSEQLAAARAGAAVGPVLAPGFLRATGKDARDYLHRMSTQDLARLAPGQAAHAAFLTARGHLVGEGIVRVEEDGALLALDPAARPGTQALLEKLVVMDEVALADASATLRAVPLLGPQARERLGARGGPRRVETARHGAPGLEAWLPPAEAEALRAELVAEGWPALDGAALEALRVLGGQPRWGAELDEGRLPMEAGLTRSAISFTKGCYIGQEVVVRATARGHLQRGLVQLALPEGAGPGTPLLAPGGAEVGRVTSAAATPDGRVGLGYLRRAHWREGERLVAGAGEAVVRRVIVEDGIPG